MESIPWGRSPDTDTLDSCTLMFFRGQWMESRDPSSSRGQCWDVGWHGSVVLMEDFVDAHWAVFEWTWMYRVFRKTSHSRCCCHLLLHHCCCRHYLNLSYCTWHVAHSTNGKVTQLHCSSLWYTWPGEWRSIGCLMAISIHNHTTIMLSHTVWGLGTWTRTA